MLKKPRRIQLVRRGEIIEGPLLTADAVVVGTHQFATAKLSRSTLSRVWEIESEGLAIVQIIDDVVTVWGRGKCGARRLSDGTLAWQTDSVYVYSWEHEVTVATPHGLEFRAPLSGEIRRVVPAPWKVAGGAVPCGTAVLVRSADSLPHVAAIDAASGVIRWNRPLTTELEARLSPTNGRSRATWFAYIDSNLVVATRGGMMFGCSTTTGDIVWQQHVPVDYYEVNIAHGRVITLYDGDLTAVDARSGGIVYRVHHANLPFLHRVISGTVYHGRIAFPASNGQVVVFDIHDGSLVQLYEGKVSLWRGVEADGRLLVSTGDGALLVFDESIWGLS